MKTNTQSALTERLEATIREIPDFPKQGILFKDITPLLLDHQLCHDIVDELIQQAPDDIDAICGVESRGFWFGMCMAQRLEVPFFPVRKKGKLPGDTHEYSYDLEYGSATVEVHKGVIKPNSRILVHDDLLATGGTAIAAAELVKQLGGEVSGFAFVVELGFLGGRSRLEAYSESISSLVSY